ncbi:hypothetical protein [Burkholderia ubonensis]|uniref:hypothetical protein n=1 Tax=Burkholderia ubonensis TaxID=101571 RepID=UPI000756BA70|nr:hypothetical protein [Burkholderia ubonensis]KVP16870.1 hypothetical protein WJ84_00935 [Burkholderia ubonensis]KVP40005.1 hypothetical protein WJ87_07430 [Burkholderia ubonensis]
MVVLELFVIITLVFAFVASLIDILAHGVTFLAALICAGSLALFIAHAYRKPEVRTPECPVDNKKQEELERQFPHCRISALPQGGWLLTNRQTGQTEGIVSR